MGNVSHSSTFQTVTDQTVSPPERTTFLSCSPFFFPPQIEASSATKYNANTVFFIMDFFLADLDLQQEKKKYETRKQKNKTPKKKNCQNQEKPRRVCAKRAGGGGEEEKLVTEWERLT